MVQGLAASMLDSFESGYTFKDRIAARDAAREQYGAQAGNPGLFSALAQNDRAERTTDSNLASQAQNREIQRSQEARAQGTYNTEMEMTEEQRKQKAVLGLVNGLRSARDRGEDIGAAFDQQIETLQVLGVAEEDIPAMRSAVVDNPQVLDDYYAALTGDAKPKSSGSDRERARMIMNDANASDADKQWASKVMGIDSASLDGTDKTAERVTNIVGELRTLYEDLEEGGGITNPDVGVFENVARFLRSSWGGRAAGRMTATENESFRRSIEAIRPHLINAMKSAEEMGARMFDSNKDMELWLSTVTDPSQDYATVMRALDEFEEMYGKAMENIQENTPEIQPGFTDPDTGAVFKGGDPGDEASWEMP